MTPLLHSLAEGGTRRARERGRVVAMASSPFRPGSLEDTSRPGARAPSPAPVLVVTDSPDLVAELQGCVAGTGVGVEVCSWGPAAAARWPSAPVVLLDADVVASVAAAGLRRRPEVHLLCRAAPGPDDYRAAVAVGAESVTSVLGGRDRLRDLLQERVAPGSPGQVVAVVPGSGGAGASTLVAALAQAAGRRGDEVLVLDCDPTGAGMARILGDDSMTGLGWPDLLASPGRVGPVSLAEAVPRVGGVGVLGAPPAELSAAVVCEVAETARRVHDLVLVDLPRHGSATGDVMARADRSLMVVRPGLTGVAAAARQVETWGWPPEVDAARSGVDVVLRGRGASPETVAGAVGFPVLARLPDHRGVEESVDLGLGPLPGRRGAWARAVGALLDTVGVAPGPWTAAGGGR